MVFFSSLVVQIKGDSSQFKEELNATRKELVAMNRGVQWLANSMFRWGAALTAFAGGIFLFLKKTMDVAMEAIGDPFLIEAVQDMEDAWLSLQISIGKYVTPTFIGLMNAITDALEPLDRIKLPKGISDFLGLTEKKTRPATEKEIAGGKAKKVGETWMVTDEESGSYLKLATNVALATIAVAGLAGAYLLLNAIWMSLAASPLAAFLTATLIPALGGLLIPIAVLIAILAVLWLCWQNNWGNIKEHADTIVKGIQQVIDGFSEALDGVFMALGGIADMIMSIIELDWEKFKKGFDKVIEGLKKILAGIGKMFVGVFNVVVFGIIGFFWDLWQGIQKWGMRVGTFLAEIFFKAVGVIGEILFGIVDAFYGVLNSIFTAIEDAINQIINLIPGARAAIAMLFGGEGLIKLPRIEAKSGIASWQRGIQERIDIGKTAMEAYINIDMDVHDFMIQDQSNVDELAKKIGDALGDAVRGITTTG